MNDRRTWLIVVAALLLRLLLLYVRGEYIVYDEGYYLLLARSLREGHGFMLNGLPHVALSPLQPVIVAGLSLLGIPDLWASRLLAAACGALLVLPAASLARRGFGERGARSAAIFVALCPALLTYLPFFPGQGWNLYFGSEPLYLLLALSAVAVGVRAALDEPWQLWLGAGALGSLAWLTRLEGIVLSAALGLSMLGMLAYRRRLALWPRAAAALAVGVVIALPYLLYLHGALGRWAISGRVQAAAAREGPAVAQRGPPDGGGSDAVNDFVWGGDTEVLWRTLYALAPSGRRMASQYWGVAGPDTTGPAPVVAVPEARAPAADSAAPHAGSPTGTLRRAVMVVAPLWLMVLAIWGAGRIRPRADAALWLGPVGLATIVPALLAYAEPRALLLLAPAACILAAGAVEHARQLLERRPGRARFGPVLPGLVVLALVSPTARDFSRAWTQLTPLQQVAAARRVVGEYLGAHLPAEARIVSWHPAIAIWAHRDWRVLPYDAFARIVGYARAQDARAVVFSRFEPSPMRDPPRAFTAVLLDSVTTFSGDRVRLEPVDATPSLFVGRLTADTTRTAP